MRKQIIIVFIVAIIIRVGCSLFVFTYPERAFGPGADSYCYHDLATRMIEYGGFSVYPKESYLPEPARMPGYPVLLYLIYKIFGPYPWAVALVQALLDSFTAVLIFKCVALMISPTAGFISGLLYALSLHQALYTTQILTETSFTLFLMLSILFLCISIRKPTFFILSAFLLGISAFIRQIGIYFPIIVAIWMMIAFRAKLKLAIKWVAILGVVFISVIAPWGIRNYKCFGKFFISTMADINIAHWNAAPVLAQIEGISDETARQRILERITAKYKVSDERVKMFGDDPEISKLMREVGIEIIRNHPFLYAKEHLLGFVKVFVHSELAYWARLLYGYERERLKAMNPISKNVLSLVMSGKIKSAGDLMYNERLKVMPGGLILLWIFISFFELGVYIVAFFGAKYIFRANSNVFWLLMFTILYFSFLPGPVGDGRFRVPIEPYISILAGCCSEAKIPFVPLRRWLRRGGICGRWKRLRVDSVPLSSGSRCGGGLLTRKIKISQRI
ncbi:MAG: glycosyltransferase family 39 protein [Candidatus Stahlbacteria bacterium]|nr:glycosyltransferase family 39 protein [Candidatus Stahlbacteria bacterium]